MSIVGEVVGVAIYYRENHPVQLKMSFSSYFVAALFLSTVSGGFTEEFGKL